MTPQEFGAALLLLGFDYCYASEMHYRHRYGLGHPVRKIAFTEDWSKVVWSPRFSWAQQFLCSTDSLGGVAMATPETHNFTATTPGNLRYLLHLITTEQKEGADTAP